MTQPWNIAIASCAVWVAGCAHRAADRVPDADVKPPLDECVRLFDTGDLDEAEKWCAIAIDLRDSPEARNVLGTIAHARRDYDRAMRQWQRALEIREDFPEAHNNLGTLLSERGEHERAAAHLRQAIAIDLGYVIAYVNLARVLTKAGDIQEAQSVYRKCREMAPDYPDCWDGVAESEVPREHRAALFQSNAALWVQSNDFWDATERMSLFYFRINDVLRVLGSTCPKSAPASDVPDWELDFVPWLHKVCRQPGAHNYPREGGLRDPQATMQQLIAADVPALVCCGHPTFVELGTPGNFQLELTPTGWRCSEGTLVAMDDLTRGDGTRLMCHGRVVWP